MKKLKNEKKLLKKLRLRTVLTLCFTLLLLLPQAYSFKKN